MPQSRFLMEVLEKLLEIPKGKVVTYAQLASLVGHPGAARAVGNALHQNPLPDIFPCFRVVNAQGRLAKNFGAGGIAEQRRRLEADGIAVNDNCVNLAVYQWSKW